MENSNRLSLNTNFQNTARPPLSPVPHVRTYGDVPVVGGLHSISRPSEEESHHHRCSSESFLLDEQPSWLDDLLNEPETPVHKGHRRSASDSIAYLGTAVDSFSTGDENKQKFVPVGSSWGSQNFVQNKDSWNASFETKPSPLSKQQFVIGESPLKSGISLDGPSSTRDDISCTLHETDRAPSTAFEKHDRDESGLQNPGGPGERNDCSQTKPSVSKTDAKRAKQQSAHRSRVRKLQYIAELERNIQSLHAEGSEVSAELEFLDQQNLILGMENRALRQRLETLSQEQLIKHLEQDMLEREIARLQTLYQIQLQQQQQEQQQQQQKQQQQQTSKHRRSKSRDLDCQFANLSLKHKETGSSSGTVNGSVHI